MLSKISWTQYFSAIAFILVVYYVYVFFRYYAGDFQHKMSQKKSYTTDDEETLPERELIPDEQIGSAELPETEDNNFDQIESLIEQLKIRIAEEAESPGASEELGLALRQIVQSYPALKYTPYKSAINELMITECGKYGLTQLDEADIAGFWD